MPRIRKCDPGGCDCCITATPFAQSLDEVAFQRSACTAAQAGNCDRLKTLLGKDPALLHADGAGGTSGYTPLHYAARSGQVAAVRLLLDAGANPNKQTTAGKATSLHRAAFMGHTTILQLLVERGGDCFLQDADGETALHKAAAQGHTGAAVFLAAHAPEALALQDRDQQTPLQIAQGGVVAILF